MTDLPLVLVIASTIGVLAFAASGAVAGARAGMDWLGLSALAAVTAIGGGTLRDVLMTQTPRWLVDFWPTVALIAIAVAAVWIAASLFPWQQHKAWMGWLFTITDAVGLATFTVVGTDIALDAGFGAGPAVVLGVLSGIGGGIIRDVLADRRIAVFFTGEVYALAALAGSITFVLVREVDVLAAFIAGTAVTLLIRLGAVAFGWRVPTLPPTSDDRPAL